MVLEQNRKGGTFQSGGHDTACNYRSADNCLGVPVTAEMLPITTFEGTAIGTTEHLLYSMFGICLSAPVNGLLLFSLRLLQSVAAITEATVLQLWKWTGLGCTDATAVAPTMVIAASTRMVRGSN